MKKTLLLLFAVGAAGTLMAQDFVQPMPGPHTTPYKQITPPTTEGAIPRIIRHRKPLQMISPFAPKELGTGAELVYYDSNDGHQHTNGKSGRPVGIRLFSFAF